MSSRPSNNPLAAGVSDKLGIDLIAAAKAKIELNAQKYPVHPVKKRRGGVARNIRRCRGGSAQLTFGKPAFTSGDYLRAMRYDSATATQHKNTKL